MTPHKLFLVLLVSLFSFTSFTFSDDGAVMSKLLAALSPSGWDSSKSYCDWSKVTCDKSTQTVVSINLDSQGLSGVLPSELNKLSNLKTFSVQKNSLSGTLPSFANMSNLGELYLASNGFTSVPQDFLLGLTSLHTLSISENGKLSPWQIPVYLTDSVNLVNVYASNASLFGVIPDFFGVFPNLQDLRLSYNNLTGYLPASFGGSEIKNLWLDNQLQGLSGTVDVISRMPQLAQVWLHANSFTGPIPDLSKCENIFDLQLRDNQFTGVLPDSLMNLPNLLTVSLQNNKLQGPTPQFRKGVKVEIGTSNSFCMDTPGPCDPQVTALLAVAGGFGYPLNLADSWKGNDACNGWSHISCDGTKKNVDFVALGKHRLSGYISPAFANLTTLRSLLLNDNNLTGSIPESLTTLPMLQTLDVTNNNLSGPIPAFRPNVKFSNSGNLFLGKNISGGRDSRRMIAVVVIAVVISVVISVLVAIYLSYKCYIKRRHNRLRMIERLERSNEMVRPGVVIGNQSSGDHSEMSTFEGVNYAYSFEELKLATNDFSEELGRGGFAVVYKGKISDGTEIAVKRMNSGAMATKGMNDFQAEITALTKFSHRHLVSHRGYCVDGNERILVLEYMPQGTLSRHLFERKKHGYDTTLMWKQKVTIALDVARGVEYLHHGAPESFIHRDLKPDNILLGDDMRAKVADFGLVKNAPDEKDSAVTQVAGTYGYIAPEYAATGRVTTKVDVYAFGVVLLVLIFGRKALDTTLTEDMILVSWFQKVILNKDDLRKAIDPTLNLDEETFESICKVADLAGRCTAREPFQRPDMGDAVSVLALLVAKQKHSIIDINDCGIDRSKIVFPNLGEDGEGTSGKLYDAGVNENSHSELGVPYLQWTEPHFVSHGWKLISENMLRGTPIMLPLFSDQTANAKVVEVAGGIGLRAEEVEGVSKREELKRCLGISMGNNEENGEEEIMSNTKKRSELAVDAVKIRGSSHDRAGER